MDGQYSWKRTEDVEIDLTDLIYRICTQWVKIVICALAFALAFGGYGWMKQRNSLKESTADIAEEASLTPDEEQAVADAVRLKQEIRGLKTYLESSVLMQLDPYHKSRYVTLYRIDGAQNKKLQTITESYLNFISNGGAADAMLQSGSLGELDKNCLAELLSAYQKTSSSNWIAADDADGQSQTEESLFYTEITGKDARTAKKMAESMQEVLEDYSAAVKENAGNHRLTLINSMESVTADSGLQSQQHDKKALLSSNQTSLKAMTDAFSKEQLAVYKEMAGIEEDEEEYLSEAVSDGDAADSGTFIKYLFFGLIAGVFVYCSIYACWYIFCDKVRNSEEMKRIYTFPVYGTVSVSGKSKKSFAPSAVTQKETCGPKEKILSRICLSCSRRKITKLYAVSDFTLCEAEKECMEEIKEKLKIHGIDMKTAQNSSMDTDAWESLSENGSVLLLCRLGFTTHRMIDEAMSFYLENGITVLGAVSFSGESKN